MEKEDILLICECTSKEHQVIFSHIVGYNTVYVSVHLSKLPFFKRVVAGLKYIFGHKCKYGNFEETILYPAHIKSLEKVIKILKNEEFKE